MSCIKCPSGEETNPLILSPSHSLYNTLSRSDLGILGHTIHLLCFHFEGDYFPVFSLNNAVHVMRKLAVNTKQIHENLIKVKA